MNTEEPRGQEKTAARVFLETLKSAGVEHLFGNAGTDFAAIIECYATHPDRAELPRPVTVPHENLAVAMAHGAYLISGKPQAVMVHVNVGTANAICGLINAARERVPLILCAGRTPVSESGHAGSRNAFIHWAQEMFDQAAMVRELVKWDYEIRNPRQTDAIAWRAVSIAMSEPRGPVYLTLPRETSCDTTFSKVAGESLRLAPSPMANDGAVTVAAEWLNSAERPVIVTGGYKHSSGVSAVLARLAETHHVAVTTERPRLLPLPTSSPAFVGFTPADHVPDADLLIVLDCDVPWIERNVSPAASTRIVHVGHDALFQNYPVRTHRADLVLEGDPASTIERLMNADASPALLQKRKEWLREKRRRFEEKAHRPVSLEGEATYSAVAHHLSAMLRSGDALAVETAFPFELLNVPADVHYFGSPSAGGLGWGLGAALGVKISQPECRAIALVGDGAYMFGNPTPAHYVSAAEQLPFLTIVLNNSMWAAVRRATLAVFPDSVTKSGQGEVFTSLEPSPAYEKIVEASGGKGIRVDRAAEIGPALEQAFETLENERRQVVVNVVARS